MKKLVFLFSILPFLVYGENDTIILPQGANYVQLTSEGQINGKYCYRLGPQNDPYLIYNNVCLNINDSTTPILVLPSFFKVTDITWVDNGSVFFSDSTSIYYADIKSDSIVQIVNTTMHDIRYKTTKYGIYYYDHDNGKELYFFSYLNVESSKIGKLSIPISDMSTLGSICFVAYGRNIGVLNGNEDFQLKVESASPITSLAVHSSGMLFFGTSEGLFYYDSKNIQYQIANYGVNSILIEGENMYVVFSDGSSGKITGISAYNKFINEYVFELNKSKYKVGKDPKIQDADKAHRHLIDDEISLAVSAYQYEIQKEQMNRSITERGVNGDRLAEYAYALALHHNFEAALINIDRARALDAKYKDFYSAQILKLMGYDNTAEQFMQDTKVPEWISNTYQTLTAKYATYVSINQDNPNEALIRANKLAANGQTIQAIVLFEELLTFYTNAYIIYVDYSTIWEKLKKYEYASKMLKKGIDLIPQDNETKATFNNHLDELNETWRKYTTNTWVKKMFGTGLPKLITYAGAAFAGKTFSLNGRIGAYTSKKFSGSLNLGLSFASEQVMGNIGISAYKGWGIFLVGLGLTDSFSKGSNSIGLSPQVGLSILNKKQTASFDFTIGCQIPFSAKPVISYSISIGETIYIDVSKRNKKN